jgi:hypothetical protein
LVAILSPFGAYVIVSRIRRPPNTRLTAQASTSD